MIVSKELRIFTDDTTIPLSKVIGRLIAILGIRGSGKTNTAAVLAEELLKAQVPLFIIDTDGEYWTLRERFDVLVIGNEDYADLKIDLLDQKIVNQAPKIAELLYKNRISTIIDVSSYHPLETFDFLEKYLSQIWLLSGSLRIPYFILVEEAHEFLPQSINALAIPLTRTLVRMALRGRKRGIGMIIISQRSARVSKDILTQGEILFLHKVVHPADLNVYKEILPLKPREVKILVSQLKTGEVLFYFNGRTEKKKVRLRETFHPGYTPLSIKIKYKNTRVQKFSELIELLREVINGKTVQITIRKGGEASAHVEQNKATQYSMEQQENPLLNLLCGKQPVVKRVVENNRFAKSINHIGKENKRTEKKDEGQIGDDKICINISALKTLSIIIDKTYRLPKRTIEILKVLILSDKYLTRKEIADRLGVRSVNKDIIRKLLNRKLIIKKKIGRSYAYKFNLDIIPPVGNKETIMNDLKKIFDFI